MHGQEKGRDERERKKNRIKADEGVNSERDRGERRQRRYNKTMVLTIIKKRRMSTTTVSASMAVFLSLVMGVLLVAMMGTTIPTTFYFQQVDAFNNAASFIINHNNNHHSHHHQISSRSRDTTSTSTSTSSSLYFQKAPAVAEAIKQSKEKEEEKIMISSLLVLLLFSVVDVDGAHAPLSSTIRQRTLQDTVPACRSSLQPGDQCDVDNEKGKKCGFGDYVYVGDCDATKEELECLPDMTCTCNGIYDGTWACPQFRRRDAMIAEMMPEACPEDGTTADERGEICTPPSPTSTASASSVTASDGNNDMTGGIDRLDTMNGADNSAIAIDETLSASKNAVDNDNNIDSVEVPTPAAVADDNESSTTITVKEGESDGAMSSLSSSSSSQQQQQGLGVAKVAMVAAAGIALFL
mmetsp:Transcript_42638/g.48311  ORF Transcript_42638/g.48311 Transcript_42638/m.48311 type:complete len:410 (-) Transcript_42638:96-1325(-)